MFLVVDVKNCCCIWNIFDLKLYFTSSLLSIVLWYWEVTSNLWNRSMELNCGIFQLTRFKLTARKWFTLCVLSLVWWDSCVLIFTLTNRKDCKENIMFILSPAALLFAKKWVFLGKWIHFHQLEDGVFLFYFLLF